MTHRVLAGLALASVAACSAKEPQLEVSTRTVNQACRFGTAEPVKATVEVRSSEPVRVTARSGADWLVVAPGEATAPVTLRLEFVVGALTVGTHRTRVFVYALGGLAPVQIDVALAVYANDPQAKPRDMMSEETLKRLKEATVLIECGYAAVAGRPRLPGKERFEASGSGFIVGDDGLILTCRSVVAPVAELDRRSGGAATEGTPDEERATYALESVRVRLFSGTPGTVRLPASVLRTAPFPDDAAVLRIRPEKPLTALFVDEKFMSLPDLEKSLTTPVWALGFPSGRPGGPDISVAAGTISVLRRSGDNALKAVEHTCRFEAGTSGGPVVDNEGRLVGMTSLGGAHFGVSIPAPTVRDLFGMLLGSMGFEREKRSARLDWLRKSGDVPVGRLRRRVLRVDENAPRREPHVHGEEACDRAMFDGGDAPFSALEDALAEAHPGDAVELAEGRFAVRATLRLAQSVWLRGRGAAKTRLVWKGEGPCLAWVRGAVEVSDLTVDCRGGTALQMERMKEPDGVYSCYVHDVVLRGATFGVRVEPGGSGNVVQTEIEADVGIDVGEKAFLHGQRVRIASSGAGFDLRGGAARIEGCTVRSRAGRGIVCTGLSAVDVAGSTGCDVTRKP